MGLPFIASLGLRAEGAFVDKGAKNSLASRLAFQFQGRGGSRTASGEGSGVKQHRHAANEKEPYTETSFIRALPKPKKMGTDDDDDDDDNDDNSRQRSSGWSTGEKLNSNHHESLWHHRPLQQQHQQQQQHHQQHQQQQHSNNAHSSSQRQPLLVGGHADGGSSGRGGATGEFKPLAWGHGTVSGAWQSTSLSSEPLYPNGRGGGEGMAHLSPQARARMARKDLRGIRAMARRDKQALVAKKEAEARWVLL